MKTVLLDLSKGVNIVTDRKLMSEGFTIVADNVDLRSGTPKPFRYPTFFRDAPSGSTRIFEFRGKWHASVRWRDYAAELVGNQERVYFTEYGPLASPPQKIIDGVQARLGTQPPTVALAVEGGESLIAEGLIATLGPGELPEGTYSYRIAGVQDTGNILPASAAVQVTIAPGKTGSVNLSWKSITSISKYIVFGRIPDSEQEMDRVTALTWTDNNNKSPSGRLASRYNPILEFKYIYTFIRDVNGHSDESGPSPVSQPGYSNKERIIARQDLLEGIFIPSKLGFVFEQPPLIITSTHSSTVGSVESSGFWNKAGSCWVSTKTGHNAKNSSVVGLSGFYGYNNETTAKITLPGTINQPYGIIPTIIAGAGGTLPVAAYNYQLTGFIGDLATALLFDFTRGVPAQTAISATSTTSVGLVGDGVRITCDMHNDVTGYFVYRNGVFKGVLDPSVGNFMDLGIAPTVTGTTPVIPTGNEIDTRVLILPFESKNPWSTYAVSEFKIVSVGTTKISLSSNHGLPIGTVRTVRIRGFTLTSVNGLWDATITGVSDFEIPLFTTTDDVAQTTHKIVEFSDLNSTGGNEFSYYKYWNLYRIGDTDQPLLVEQIPIETMTYVDTKSIDFLGNPPDSYYFDGRQYISFEEAPEGLEGLENHYQMLFGIYKNSVRWGPKNRPDAFPTAYTFFFPSRPMRLASYASFLVVLCQDALYLINGFDPGSLILTKSLAEDGCIAPRSVQKTSHGLLYLAKRGIMSFDGNNSVCLTESRVPGTFFTNGSSLKNSIPYWWFPTEQTYNYAALSMAQEGGFPGAGTTVNKAATNRDNESPDGVNLNIRSFYWRNKYFIFWSDYI
jgi:hypothetical protein